MSVWRDITNAMIDAGSPMDETLWLWVRDNQVFLKNQLGGNIYGDGSDGAGSYAAGTTDATKRLYQFTTLSISAGAVFRFPDGFGIVKVQGDVTLGGTLRCRDLTSGAAAAADGVGGPFFAMMDYNNRVRTLLDHTPAEGGVGGGADPSAGGGGAGLWGYGGVGGGAPTKAGGICMVRLWDNFLPPQDHFKTNPNFWLYGRSGSGGGGNGTGSTGGDAGGTLLLLVGGDIGGAGTVDCAGQNGANGTTRAGGGGGGGGIFCGVAGDVSAMTFDGSGGDGGSNTVDGGGGGGGRLVLIYGGSDSSSKDVTGGTNGGGGGGSTAGQAGLSTAVNADPIERWV
jgi:hypothetical protein